MRCITLDVISCFGYAVQYQNLPSNRTRPRPARHHIIYIRISAKYIGQEDCIYADVGYYIDI